MRFEKTSSAVTIQVAYLDRLAVPMTVDLKDFYSWANEQQQSEWLKRQARALLDIYGDARDGRTLSDQEVLDRANTCAA